MKKNALGSRRFRYGTFATVLSVGFLVVIVLLNVIASALMEKFPLKIDLTDNKMFDITQESKDYIKDLNKDIEITVLSTESSFTAMGTYFQQANEVLKSYVQNSSHVSIKYVDIVKDPTFAQKYPQETLAVADVLVTCGDQVRKLDKASLFDVQTDENNESYSISSLAEQAITSAIMSVTSDVRPKVVIAAGYGETQVTDFESLISKNNFEVVTRDLAKEDIDADALFLVCIAPKYDYDQASLAKIEAFLSNDEKLGKNVLYFTNPDQAATPNINAFLSENGVDVGEGSVYETNKGRIFNNNPFFSIVDYVSNDFYKKLKNNAIFASMPRSRPLSLSFANKGYVETAPLLNFSTTAAIQPVGAGDNWTPSSDDIDSSRQIPAMVRSSRLRYEGSDVIKSNIIVAGSTVCLDNTLLSSTSVTNSEYFLNIFNVLADRDESINIVSKQLGSSNLNITTQQTNTIAVIFAIVLPLIVIIIGISIWFVRRHK